MNHIYFVTLGAIGTNLETYVQLQQKGFQIVLQTKI